MHKRLRYILAPAVLALPAALLVAVGSTPAYSHGYTTSPQSRAQACAEGEASDCGPIKWEPHSVEGPKGFPSGGPADGEICAAGDSRWAPLDDPRNGNWPATTVQPGQNYTLSWTLTAAHATDRFEYYITKDSYDPTQPLTRDQLELEPFHTVDYGGERPPWTVNHAATLPDKSGRHLLLSVWVIADTGNAFYQCADVVFGSEDGGGNPGDPPDPPSACETAGWDADTAYTAGDQVTHAGHAWEAEWWTKGQEPGTTGEWGAWRDQGAC